MLKLKLSASMLINISIVIIFCVACDNNLYEETSSTQKEMVIIGETDKNRVSEKDTKIITDKKYNEGEVFVIIKKGYGDISKNKNVLLKNAKIIFSFSDDEKESILLVKNENYTTEELIKELKDLPEVISVEPNYNLNTVHINK